MSRFGPFIPAPWRRRLATFVRGAPDRRHAALKPEVTARLAEARLCEQAAWNAVATLEDWTAFARPRLHALARSLGALDDLRKPPVVRVVRVVAGDGFAVEHVVFPSRAGAWATAHLYRPAERGGPAPAILVCHSHHDAKEQAELRELGAGWARAGAVVLVPDLVGHGERRDHPFPSTSADRQDYRFRYVLGMQLDLAGDSLMGWMVGDVRRGIDVLAGRPDVDARRIVVIGAVAGGGDVAAVAAALDPRVACVVPFNFGTDGGGSWESTRNLRGSARDGFAPWLVLAMVAPRRLVHAHEFAWSADADPIWQRLARVWELHGVPERLAAIHGRGTVAGPPPDNTHCTNVGAVHRAALAPILRDGLGIPLPRDTDRACTAAVGACWSRALVAELAPRRVHEVARAAAAARLARAREERGSLPPGAVLDRLRTTLAGVLGVAVEPAKVPVPRGARATRSTFEPASAVRVRIRLRLPPGSRRDRPGAVLAIAQDGGGTLVRRRRTLVRELLGAGLAVCTVDVRGAGPSPHDDEHRGRRAVASEIASAETMLGGTLLGARLGDTRAALAWLRAHPALDPDRIGVWGDSLAPPNGANVEVRVPFDAVPAPAIAEPLGATLALLVMLFEPDVRAAYARGGLVAFASILDAPFCHVPADVIVPGLLAVADVPDLVSALGPRVRHDAAVDGRNRLAGDRGLGDREAALWLARRLRPARADRARIAHA